MYFTYVIHVQYEMWRIAFREFTSHLVHSYYDACVAIKCHINGFIIESYLFN